MRALTRAEKALEHLPIRNILGAPHRERRERGRKRERERERERGRERDILILIYYIVDRER